jgi:putative peptide zinc metalloprotease protein
MTTNEMESGGDIYDNAAVQIETALPGKDENDIWDATGEAVDILLKKPRRKDSTDYELSQQENKKNQVSYIIKDITNNSYISLTEEEFFVWELLDGKSTISDICYLYFNKYNKISRMPVKLIEKLEGKNMLKDSSWDIYAAAKKAQYSPWRLIPGKVSKFFLSGKFSLKNIDKAISFIYNKFAWLFFRKEAIFFYCILIVAGLTVFFSMGYFGQKFAVRNYINFKFSTGILFICTVFPVILHELSHAFACKKYGRKVNRAGLMLYVGLPVLFVETTDIWTRPRKERILVSLAGPFTDLLVGSLCFLLHSIFGNFGILQLFPLIGLISYLRCLYNFNPLLEFDGYYILMDILEIPELRKRSFEFLKNGGIKKLFTSRKLEKEEYIFLLYGIVAGIYTYFMIFFMLYIWQTQIRSLLIEIWKNKHTSIFSQLLIVAAFVVIFIRLSFVGKIIFKKIGPLAKFLYLKLAGINKKSVSKTGGRNEK